jgi:hypothetical protein
VVPLLHHDECDPWLVILLQLDAGLADGQQLVMENLGREWGGGTCFRGLFPPGLLLKTNA